MITARLEQPSAFSLRLWLCEQRTQRICPTCSTLRPRMLFQPCDKVGRDEADKCPLGRDEVVVFAALGDCLALGDLGSVGDLGGLGLNSSVSGASTSLQFGSMYGVTGHHR